MPVDLGKVPPSLVDMRKKADRTLSFVGLPDLVVKVKCLVDRSGSLDWAWMNGSLQRQTEANVALASAVDDDGIMPTWLFHSTVYGPYDIGLDNFAGALDEIVVGRFGSSTSRKLFGKKHTGQPIGYGGTDLAAGMNAVIDHTLDEEDDLPTLCIVVTDGAPDDKWVVQTLVEVTAARDKIFWCFMFVGTDERGWEWLDALDKLPGRPRDNTTAFRGDPQAGQDNYLAMLREVPAWLASW